MFGTNNTLQISLNTAFYDHLTLPKKCVKLISITKLNHRKDAINAKVSSENTQESEVYEWSSLQDKLLLQQLISDMHRDMKRFKAGRTFRNEVSQELDYTREVLASINQVLQQDNPSSSEIFNLCNDFNYLYPKLTPDEKKKIAKPSDVERLNAQVAKCQSRTIEQLNDDTIEKMREGIEKRKEILEDIYCGIISNDKQINNFEKIASYFMQIINNIDTILANNPNHKDKLDLIEMKDELIKTLRHNYGNSGTNRSKTTFISYFKNNRTDELRELLLNNVISFKLFKEYIKDNSLEETVILCIYNQIKTSGPTKKLENFIPKRYKGIINKDIIKLEKVKKIFDKSNIIKNYLKQIIETIDTLGRDNILMKTREHFLANSNEFQKLDVIVNLFEK